MLALAVAAVAADQLTKATVVHRAARGRGGRRPARASRSGTCATRASRSASSPAGSSFVVLLTVGAVIWMLAFFARSGARHPLVPVAIGLLLGGSVSNLWDRAYNSFVTDFIYVRVLPELQSRRQLHRHGRRAADLRARARRSGRAQRGLPVGRELIAEDEAAGARLDRYLAEHAGLPSRAAAERLIERGAVRVDGEPAHKALRLAGGELIELEDEAASAPAGPEAGRRARDPARADRRARDRRRQARRGRHASGAGRGRADARGRAARPRPARRRRRAAPGRDPPARPRHLRPARALAQRRGLRGARRADARARRSSASTSRSCAAARPRAAARSTRPSAAIATTSAAWPSAAAASAPP